LTQISQNIYLITGKLKTVVRHVQGGHIVQRH